MTEEAALVADICRQTSARLEQVSLRTTARIRDAIGEYDAVPTKDHRLGVFEQQRRLLTAMADLRGPDDDDLAAAAALGRRRAWQGVGIAAVMSAFHVGNRALWEILDEVDGEQRLALPRLSGLMWQWMESVTARLADAHAAVLRTRDAHEMGLWQQWVDVLEADPVAGPDAPALAALLGFDVDGPFCVGVIRSAAGDGGDDPVATGTTPQLVDCLVVPRRHDLVVVTQKHDAAALRTLVDGARGTAAAGVGLRRHGLDGAVASLTDAREAAAACRPAGTALFESTWWEATVWSRRRRLEPLVAEGFSVVSANPHLAETVRAFLDAGLSVGTVASLLHVHPNTVAYRLDRWRALTGWDVRTRKGLQSSLLLLSLADRPDAAAPRRGRDGSQSFSGPGRPGYRNGAGVLPACTSQA